MPATRSFPEFCAEVRERYAKAGAGRIDPELPFRMCDEHGASFDPVTNLLLAAGAILLALAAAITAIFTTGLVFQALAGLTVVLFVVWLL
ncbi:MAG: hypothetical protein JNK15_11680, partial [Planctomycetes bacterium]|nr:hypothetical protein [Planctomycetota bacterium]